MKLSWFIANRIGKKKTKLGGIGNIIAIASVTISVAVIIIAIAISNGFRKEIKEKALAFSGDVTISPLEGFSPDQDNQAIKIDTLRAISRIKALPFVKSIEAISLRPGMIKTDDQIQGIVLQGVDSTYDWSVLGTALVDSVTNPLLISKRLAGMLELKNGDGVLIYFVINQNVKVRKFNICGIYPLQFEDYDKTYLFTTKRVVDQLNGWEPNSASIYVVNYKDHTDSQMDARRNAIIREIYDKINPDDPAISVLGLHDSLSGLFDWLHLLDTNVLIILILMILVAGFNMVSSLLIILFENISKIGILKTLGMNNSGIKKVFLAKSSKIVFYGIILGDAIGIAICLLQKYFKLISLNPDTYFLDAVPIDFSVWNVVFTDLLSFAAIMTILLIPCHYISRISPAKTIKAS